MIISHKHKYLFIQIPHTGSTAIGDELCENYDGFTILRKHSSYHEFQRIANDEEKKYFVFASIRNPLETIISSFFKMKTNHKGRYTNPYRYTKDKKLIVTSSEMKKFHFIHNNSSDFSTFFKEFYRLWYTDTIVVSHKKIDYIIRYENIQNDFSNALNIIGIKQKRPLPHINKTSEKEDDYLSYYTPGIIGQAKTVFGPFMRKWHYDFPQEWGENNATFLDIIGFNTLYYTKYLYRKYVKYDERTLFTIIKKIVNV